MEIGGSDHSIAAFSCTKALTFSISQAGKFAFARSEKRSCAAFVRGDDT
jgi:hypothetical protein